MTQIVTGDNYNNSQDGRKGNWMQTFSGRQFWPLDPRASEVFIEDIAHGLSNSCRYAGHCLHFYSVAEHSVLLSYIVPEDQALSGLLHDAPEAYVVDIPRPLKPFLTGYKEIDAAVWRAIAERFGIPEKLSDEIKHADNAMLLTEQIQNMAPAPAPWGIPGDPAPVDLKLWSPAEAKREFLHRFRELYSG